MKILSAFIGAIVGAVFGLYVAMATATLVSDGNTVGEGFFFLAAAPGGLLIGAVVGLVLALRALASFRAKPASDADRRKRRRMLYGLFVGIPAAFMAVRWVDREAAEPPSDAAMLKHFEQHAGTLDALIKMTSADKQLTRVGDTWTLPEDAQGIGLPKERLASYRKLLHEAGTPYGFMQSRDQPGVDFYYWQRGSAISDDESKGFAYRVNPPPGVVPTLDDIQPSSRDILVAYRHIRENWYLFYEFIPD